MIFIDQALLLTRGTHTTVGSGRVAPTQLGARGDAAECYEVRITMKIVSAIPLQVLAKRHEINRSELLPQPISWCPHHVGAPEAVPQQWEGPVIKVLYHYRGISLGAHAG